MNDELNELSDAFLKHATRAASQYDSLCRSMAAEILCLRHALNRCAHHSDLKILHEQTRCSVCLTGELRALTERAAMIESDYQRVCNDLKNLRDAVRSHRDARGDDRCWRDDEDLYATLPEGFTPLERDTSVQLEACQRYITSRQHPATVYVSPERELEKLRALIQVLTEKAIRFDLDRGGIEAREQESVELVERRAQVAEAFGVVQGIMGIDLTGDDPDDLVPSLQTLRRRLDVVINKLDVVSELTTVKHQLDELSDAIDKDS